jgi:pantoate--beta-alanine ligase
MQVVDSIPIARATLRDARALGMRIGIVPTMGALHEGHLSLVDASRAECDFHVVTIFVNPTQFAPHEDLDCYPRTLDDDLAALATRQVDLVFVPSNELVYPAGFSTYIEPPDVAKPLEGAHRPGHFRGVTTVVLKLFHMIPADVAFFGQKDFQQCLVVQAMVQDLNLDIEIRICPTVREPDGLAMSSRNRYLNALERERALSLSRSLNLAQHLYDEGERDSSVIVGEMMKVLRDARVDRVDYVQIADSTSLCPLPRIDRPAVALIAAHVGNTRLIDNRRLE